VRNLLLQNACHSEPGEAGEESAVYETLVIPNPAKPVRNLLLQNFCHSEPGEAGEESAVYETLVIPNPAKPVRNLLSRTPTRLCHPERSEGPM